MRVIVCGGRNYQDRTRVHSELDRLDEEYGPFAVMIHGASKGADLLAGAWAAENQRLVLDFRADWNTYGKKAGPIRNQRMIYDGKPDLVIAFPGGRGTADMVRRARKACVEVVVVDPRL